MPAWCKRRKNAAVAVQPNSRIGFGHRPLCLVQKPCGPWQSVRTATYVQPRERIRKTLGLRLARLPNQVRADAVAVPCSLALDTRCSP